jgi:hypothetical protein
LLACLLGWLAVAVVSQHLKKIEFRGTRKEFFKKKKISTSKKSKEKKKKKKKKPPPHPLPTAFSTVVATVDSCPTLHDSGFIPHRQRNQREKIEVSAPQHPSIQQ